MLYFTSFACCIYNSRQVFPGLYQAVPGRMVHTVRPARVEADGSSGKTPASIGGTHSCCSLDSALELRPRPVLSHLQTRDRRSKAMYHADHFQRCWTSCCISAPVKPAQRTGSVCLLPRTPRCSCSRRYSWSDSQSEASKP